MNLPVGVNQWATRIGNGIGSTLSDAIVFMTNTSEQFSSFLEGYVASRQKYLNDIADESAIHRDSVIPLSGECHLGGSYVLLDSSQDLVFYSAGRSNPVLFRELSEWYCAELNLPRFSRRIEKKFGKSICKKYIKNTAISDPLTASTLSGFLLALAWFTSTTDLHSANLVYTNNVPIVIDDECVLHPLRNSQIDRLDEYRKHYPFSPFRTILFQEKVMGNRKAESGFAELLAVGLDDASFFESFVQGFNFLKAKKDCLFEIIYNGSRRGDTIRYLMRGTEFYDSCIAFASMKYFEGAQREEVKVQLQLKFEAELSLFPETSSFTSHEIECVLDGEVPYFSVSLSDGSIFSKIDGDTLGYVPAPEKWVNKNVRYASAWSEYQLRCAITLGLQWSESLRSRLPVFI